ncbi:MAG: proton-conducting transporter membrane subunit, partial [Hydrogenobacter sp.]
IAGFIYNRLHSFNMDALKGSAKFMPLFAIITVITAYSSMGLPGGSSFWGKFLTVLSAREYTTQLALLVIAGAFFSVIYMLYLMKVLFLDTKEESRLVHFADIRGFKLSAFLLLVIPMFMVGLLPSLFFNIFDMSAKKLLLYVMHKLIGG